jgi:hypothetical protein
MMTLDIGMIGLLLKFRPNQKNIENLKRVFSQYSRQIILFTGIYVLLGSTIYGWIIQRTYERLEHIGQVLESNTVQLEPEKWIGKEFPLRNYVISDQDFIHGHWKVLLSRPGCNVCENVKQKFADDKSFMTISLSDKNIHNKMTFQLTPNVHWIANTPILIILENGVVKNVQIREQLLSAMETHLF